MFFQEELLHRISQKLDVLRAEQLSLKEEVALNEDLGRNVSREVHAVAKPNECVKFNLHIEEIDKITSLLLGLSGRLARTENSLAMLPQGSRIEERVSTICTNVTHLIHAGVILFRNRSR